MHKVLKSALIGTTALAIVSPAAFARDFDIPRGDLKVALDAYMKQAGIALMYPPDSVAGVRSQGARGELPAEVALAKILAGTGFATERTPTGAIGIVREEPARTPVRTIADAEPIHAAASVETVVVTSSKIKGDIQTVPIAITALSQEQLTERQIAGGPDLVKEVPNLTFSKTNFTGYNIEIRGIGTQAISVTTDPGVAVAFNDVPFIRNHFFEQEFYDVSQVEVLRGPQGTLYGRNATAGVVNVVSAKPTDQFEAMLSADWGNYTNRRYEGMINLPIVDDKLALRIAGEWTKRDGYSFNSLTDKPIDGRDLWSSRTSLRWRPVERLTLDFVWEHFQEDDDRLRSGKQLCDRETPPASILGVSTATDYVGTIFLNQNCLPGSLYSPDAFGVPNALALPYYGGIIGAGGGAILNPLNLFNGPLIDAYASTVQSHNLRVIESTLNPVYRANNDTLEFNAEWNVTPSLTFNSETGYNRDFLWSTEDFNRFNTQPGVFAYTTTANSHVLTTPDGNYRCIDTGEVTIGGNYCSSPNLGQPTGIFCDPQLGCSNRLVGEDLSEEHSWQFSQELRLTSNFKGPFNFSFGGNYMHYVTSENYYVFFNTLTMFAAVDGIAGRNPNEPWIGGVSTNVRCTPNGHQYANPQYPTSAEDCLGYIDPNPLTSLDNEGHNYFLSQNPYSLNSYALFGETYYDVTKNLKLTAGLRWTDDQKHFAEIPSELLTDYYGYPTTGYINQEWKKWTGRFVAEWSPQLPITDQSMFYASYAHGYKAGGANPPGAVLLRYQAGDISNPTHPTTFAPEFNDAFEIGTKNTGLDGDLTLNADIFYYDYKGYQISQIVDRTSVNLNFDATVRGAEIQATWSPVSGLKFGFSGGYEHTRLANGSNAIDLMDRTAGNPDWVLVKPFVTQASNCVAPAYVVAYLLVHGGVPALCGNAYNLGLDPATSRIYSAFPGGTNASTGAPIDPAYPGFDPNAGTSGDPYTGQNTYNGIDYGPVPNGGAGFSKDLSGNELPNAPHFTTSFTADYTMPVSENWAATLHGDFYWQSQSWARVYNDNPYDKLRGYSNVNLALILNDATGWQVMGYVKNIFDTTAITGTFLNSDDTGLTTNVFLTDPRLYGVRVTKNFESGGGFDLFSSVDGARPQFWLTLGGDYALLSASDEKYVPAFVSILPAGLPTQAAVERNPVSTLDWEGSLTFQPSDSDWKLAAHIRYGRSSTNNRVHVSLPAETEHTFISLKYHVLPCTHGPHHATCTAIDRTFSDVVGGESEKHTILDFTLGKDVGIGMFGRRGSGTVGAGIRMAQFDSSANFELNADPHYVLNVPVVKKNYDVYDAKDSELRGFHGLGPELTWAAEQPIWGNLNAGEVALDWGVNAAMLFGRQKAAVTHEVTHQHCGIAISACNVVPTGAESNDYNRSRRVTVPNLGGYVGASVQYQNAKISLGYRADEFFNAMDGGQATAKKYDRGFYGPYLNLSIGFGG